MSDTENAKQLTHKRKTLLINKLKWKLLKIYSVIMNFEVKIHLAL